MPYFYSDQFDLGMEYRGYAPQWGKVVVRGDLDKREFLAFWLADNRVVAAMNANVWDQGKELQRLVESEERVDLSPWPTRRSTAERCMRITLVA